MHIEERLDKEPWVQRKKARRRKRYKEDREKENITPEKGDMTSANETNKKIPGGYEFLPLVANQLWHANQHVHACFALYYALISSKCAVRPRWKNQSTQGHIAQNSISSLTRDAGRVQCQIWDSRVAVAPPESNLWKDLSASRVFLSAEGGQRRHCPLLQSLAMTLPVKRLKKSSASSFFIFRRREDTPSRRIPPKKVGPRRSSWNTRVVPDLALYPSRVPRQR